MSPYLQKSQNLGNGSTEVLKGFEVGVGEIEAQPAFAWGVGIECSFVPHLNVDQFEWTQHNRFWREDFRRATEELGVKAMRYALPWHQIETSPGVFDWTIADERIAFAVELGLDLHLDVMHFGTPKWLAQAAGDPEFPESLERWTAALVDRYRASIRTWCPCNEPLILALFSGDFGFWPPHGRKWRGYMPVLSRIVQGVSRSIRAIRRTDPQATVLLCDNVENYKSRDPELATEVQRRNLRRFLAMDLLIGRMDRHHPLFSWVSAYGMTDLDLDWFRANPQRPDILGIDYYPNSEWQLDRVEEGIRQRRSESPAGLYGIARDYYNRYGLPMMLTETSADGQAINREIWMEKTIADCRRLRAQGIPMLGYFWWPMIDQIDWDGALTHRVGKIHEVGLYTLKRKSDGTLARQKTSLADEFARIVAQGDGSVGPLEEIIPPVTEDSQLPAIGVETPTVSTETKATLVELPDPVAERSNGNGSPTVFPSNNGSNGHAKKRMTLDADEVTAGLSAQASEPAGRVVASAETDRDDYGIVVFSHLRWGFVWQRPQQYLSRFAKRHRVLFIEEPFFDLAEQMAPRTEYHQVMPNLTVVAPHFPPSWQHNPELPGRLREFTQEAIIAVNDHGEFDRPLLWYYSPMDSAWSLGHFACRSVVYDCMDELSQFTGAPKSLIENEARLMRHADVVFTGGFELGEKKAKQHPNVHAFGCGVDVSHFSKAADPDCMIPPDIDFMARPILGWFGVVDERVDYALIAEMARLRPSWSFAMVGPVVKVDPNSLPHAHNLFWLGSRDYQQLPSYCAAFDVNMMCFAINAATEFINPTKGLEYMATGKPIVSTPVRDVVRQWSDIVRIARTAEEFVAAAEDALRQRGNDPRVARGIELAKKNSWERNVESMQRLIREAAGNGQRPSQKEISPIGEPEMEFAFTATQGS